MVFDQAYIETASAVAYGETPLTSAAAADHTDTVELLACGAGAPDEIDLNGLKIGQKGCRVLV